MILSTASQTPGAVKGLLVRLSPCLGFVRAGPCCLAQPQCQQAAQTKNKHAAPIYMLTAYRMKPMRGTHLSSSWSVLCALLPPHFSHDSSSRHLQSKYVTGLLLALRMTGWGRLKTLHQEHTALP